MKPNTQFKIETIEELIEFYNQNARDFVYSLRNEKKDFNKGNRWIFCSSANKIYLVQWEQENFKTIANPMLKKRGKKDLNVIYKTAEPVCQYFHQQNLNKAMDDLNKASKELGYRVDVVFESLG